MRREFTIQLYDRIEPKPKPRANVNVNPHTHKHGRSCSVEDCAWGDWTDP